MDKQALKNILYGSLREIAQDNRYYHHSPFGGKYSHWTEEGEKVAMEVVSAWVEKMLATEAQILDKRAKELVINELKTKE